MQILDREDSEILLKEMVNNIPAQLLHAVSRESGRRESQLLSEILHWLPRSIRSDRVSVWVGEILDWFVARGDMEKGKGGRYCCVPPYLIGTMSDESLNNATLWVFGDPRAEQILRQALQPFGRVMAHEIIYSEEKGETENTSMTARPPLGLERFIRLPSELYTKVAQACISAGIVTVQPEDLTVALPRLDMVVVPADIDLVDTPVIGGLWEIYDPVIKAYNRWRQNANWSSGQSRLIRWRPNDDRRTERNARIFYHSGGGRVAELGSESASLWQLHLDKGARRPRTVWRKGRQIWVPRMIPGATQQWLRVLAVWSSHSRGDWLIFELTETPAKSACDKLAETLGLRCRQGEPA